MHCLIIGYGSIGSRHASILKELGLSISIVSKRNIRTFPCYASIQQSLESKTFEYVIISNETCNHYNSFIELNRLGYSGKLLIEKPLFSQIHDLPETGIENVFVGYNLRFHPVIQKLREVVRDKEQYSIQAYVGQYLPEWRLGVDYTKCYSASKEKGGGVLRDLSHELDYINWIAGEWNRVAAIGGKFSHLQVNSDDIFGLLLETRNCPLVSIQMNYLDRKPRREIIINLRDSSIKADLIFNTLEMNGELTEFKVEKNFTYMMEHKTILNGDYSTACTLEQGMDVLNLIHAAELASKKQAWVNKSGLELIL